jgi:hypothetical protein
MRGTEKQGVMQTVVAVSRWSNQGMRKGMDAYFSDYPEPSIHTMTNVYSRVLKYICAIWREREQPTIYLPSYPPSPSMKFLGGNNDTQNRERTKGDRCIMPGFQVQ